MRRDRRRLVLPVALGLVLGLSGAAVAAFSSSTSNAGNSFAAAADWEPPTISSSVVSKSPGYLAGKIKQGGTFYVYANVSDGGNPASGVASVTANVSTISSAGTVALSPGSFSAEGVSYGYRSALQTASNPLAAGTYTVTLTATDAGGYASGPTDLGVVVDDTAPAGADVQTENASGLTAGKAEAGDTITYTWSEQIDPESILAGWDGTTTTVRGRIRNNGCGGGIDELLVQTSAGVTLPFGSVCLANSGYVAASRNFTGSTMTQSGSTITVTLGTPSGATGTVLVAGTMSWTPSATAYDAAGNACSTGATSETGLPDVEF
jgi:hypothetical protein